MHAHTWTCGSRVGLAFCISKFYEILSLYRSTLSQYESKHSELLIIVHLSQNSSIIYSHLILLLITCYVGFKCGNINRDFPGVASILTLPSLWHHFKYQLICETTYWWKHTWFTKDSDSHQVFKSISNWFYCNYLSVCLYLYK